MHRRGERRNRELHRSSRRARHKPWPLQAWLLLLLAQKPGHGYELMGRLIEEEKITGIDPGFLYRTLRHMENEEMITSSWDTEGEGPPRRLYTLTEGGVAVLHETADDIEQIKNQMARYLNEFNKYQQSQDA